MSERHGNATTDAQLGRDEIAGLVPHAGAMCLLDGVLRWDRLTIRCFALTHRAPSNPLRNLRGLPILAGIEYAAQAMAVHGALASPEGRRSRSGFLASLRDVVCRAEWLDRMEQVLIIEAERLLGEDDRVIYQFRLGCEAAEVLSGRAAVVLRAVPT